MSPLGHAPAVLSSNRCQSARQSGLPSCLVNGQYWRWPPWWPLRRSSESTPSAPNPPGLFYDEASNGYDAYCLLETGRNRLGTQWPLFFPTLETINEGLYRYLMVPSIAAFGLNEWAVRLPAAIAGALTTLLLFCAVRMTVNQRLAVLSAAMLAISPWHILMSRIGFRAVLLPLLVLIAVVAAERGRARPGWFLVSGLAVGLSMHTYVAAALFVPPVRGHLDLALSGKLKQDLGIALASATVAGVVAAPVVMMSGIPSAWRGRACSSSRARGSSW